MDIQDLLNGSPPSTAKSSSLDPEIDQCLRKLQSDDADEDDLRASLEQLATTSRESEILRIRLADTATLAQLDQVITSKDGKPSRSLQPALRCLGNACFENEGAADRVASFGLDWAATVLHSGDQETIAITTNVLNNICIQSIDAQKQACKIGLDDELLYRLTRAEETAISVPLDLVLLIISHRKETNRQGLPSWAAHGTDFTTDLLAWANRTRTSLSVDDWACTLEITLIYLREVEVQTLIVEKKQVDGVWSLLSKNENWIAGSNERGADCVEDDIEPEEVRRILKPESMSLTWILSDLAAHTSFVSSYGLEDPWLQTTIVANLLQPSSAVLGATAALNSDARPNAACQVLGNVLHTLPLKDAVPLVQEQHLHQPLFAAMAGTDDADFLHSATGLLIKLARPSPDICGVIAADSNLLPALEKMNAHPMQQLKQDALALMRVLGKDLPAVQERLKDVAKDVLVAAAAAQSQEAASSGAPQALSPEPSPE